MNRIIATTALALTCATHAFADAPKVVTDIAPIQSLVKLLMQDVAEPTQITSGISDPHHVTLRPSQANLISKADIIFWIGPELTPWLDESLPTLAPNIENVALLDVPDTYLLEGTDAHHGHDEHNDHDEGPGHDPHAWLNLYNASLWANHITKTLVAADPENKATYEENADRAQKLLFSLEREAAKSLDPIRTMPIVTEHAGFAYIIDYFGLNHIGSLTDTGDHNLGPNALSKLRDQVEKAGPTCMIAETGGDHRLIKSVFSDDMPYKIIELSPLGNTDVNFMSGWLDLIITLGSCVEIQ